MGKRAEVSLVERSDDSTDSGAENDAVANDERREDMQETLLLHDKRPRISVGTFYLLSLTCGVGG